MLPTDGSKNKQIHRRVAQKKLRKGRMERNHFKGYLTVIFVALHHKDIFKFTTNSLVLVYLGCQSFKH